MIEKSELRFSYRLQFFAESSGEKSEEASPKKITDARKEGQVAKSQELIVASGLMSLFLVLKIFIGNIGSHFIESFTSTYGMIDVFVKEEFNISLVSDLLKDMGINILLICMPVFAVGILVVIVTNIFQVKWVPTSKPLMPKLSKINPISGFKKIFSKDKLVELIKSILKIAVIIYMVINTLKDEVDKLYLFYEIGNLEASILLIGDIVIDLGIRISILFLVIGFADLFYQKKKFKKDMMMTKQEVKDEFKQTEGDPKIKSRIRQKMREASQRRMMQQLPKADVVITNPTHFACALMYDKSKAEAPLLIAKGADYVAGKIKDVARENNIPIVENKPLARMLYYNVELEEEIPQELYQMVAEVLAYVYSLKK